MAKINAALASEERGNYEAAINQLQALYNEIEASLDRFTPIEEGVKLLSETDKTKKDKENQEYRKDKKKEIWDLYIKYLTELGKKINALEEKKEKKGLTPEEEAELKKLKARIKEIEKIYNEGYKALQTKDTEKPYCADTKDVSAIRRMRIITDWTMDRMYQAKEGQDVCPAGWECKADVVGGTEDPKTGITEVPPGTTPPPPEIGKPGWKTGIIAISYAGVHGPTGTEVIKATASIPKINGKQASTREFPEPKVDPGVKLIKIPTKDEEGELIGKPSDLIVIKINIYEVIKDKEERRCSIKLLIHLGGVIE